MVLTNNIADHAGGLFIGLIPIVVELVHGEQDAPVHRLQTIPNVWQGPTDNHTHRVIKIGLLHLVFDIDGDYFFGYFTHV